MRRIAISVGPALLIAFGVSFVLIICDTFFFTPSGAVAWHDDYGNPVPPHLGVPVYAEPHLVGIPMRFVLVAGFLSALTAFLVAGWPPHKQTEEGQKEVENHSEAQMNWEQRLLSRITSNPAILGGKPIVRGSKIPVEEILILLNVGASYEEIMEYYPALDWEDIEACSFWKSSSGSS